MVKNGVFFRVIQINSHFWTLNVIYQLSAHFFKRARSFWNWWQLSIELTVVYRMTSSAYNLTVNHLPAHSFNWLLIKDITWSPDNIAVFHTGSHQGLVKVKKHSLVCKVKKLVYSYNVRFALVTTKLVWLQNFSWLSTITPRSLMESFVVPLML